MTTLEVANNETKKVIDNTLRSFPVFTLCPHCRKGVNTVTEKSSNFCNLLCCIFFTPVWTCCQVVKVKDLNCYDATHTCTKCNKQIGTYSAW